MAETETKKHKAVTTVDATKPLYLVFYQTETRNVIEVFESDQGENNAERKAEDRAAELARSAKRTVLVIGPQRAAFAPPLEVQKATFDF